MKITNNKLLFGALSAMSILIYMPTIAAAGNSLWDTLRAEVLQEGSIFKSGKQDETAQAQSAPETAKSIVQGIEREGGVTKRTFDQWFGSQQDLVSGRFIGAPEPHTHNAGNVLHTFTVDIPASQKLWHALSPREKNDYDNSPILIITIGISNEHAKDQTKLAPVRIGKSRKNGYSVSPVQ